MKKFLLLLLVFSLISSDVLAQRRLTRARDRAASLRLPYSRRPSPEPLAGGGDPIDDDDPQIVDAFNDPTVTGTTGWSTTTGAVFDPNFSRTGDGSGSWKTTQQGADVFSTTVDLTEFGSGYYMYSYFVYTQSIPARYGSQTNRKNASGTFIRNSDSLTWGDFSRADKWEEVVKLFYVDVSVEPKLSLQVYQTEFDNDIWFDDFYLAKVNRPYFATPPSTKKPFFGDRVRIDKLGNWSEDTDNNGTFVDIFPRLMHVDGGRADHSIYPNNGWNANIWASTDTQVQKDETAGQFSLFKLSDYIIASNALYNDISTLNSRLSTIISNDNLKNVIGYYWDNENAFEQDTVPGAVIDAVKALDPDAPIYVLEGSEHVSRYNAAQGRSNTNGTYTVSNVDVEDTSLNTFAYQVLKSLPGNNVPASIAQISNQAGHPGKMRMGIYNALIAGARGIAYYGDNLDFNNPPIEEQEWYHDFPEIADEIDNTLLPVIKKPHWTHWSASADTTKVKIGTRQYGMRELIFIVNQTTTPQTVTISLNGLSVLDGAQVVDFFNGWQVSEVTSNTFTVEVDRLGAKRGTLVVEVDGVDTVDYDLLGNFGTNYGAGSVPSTLNDDVGSFTAVQLSQNLETADSKLIVDRPSSGFGWDQMGIIGTNAITRDYGQCFFGTINFTTVDSSNLGWSLTSSLSQNLNAGFRFETGSLKYHVSGAQISVLNSGLSTGVDYECLLSFDTQANQRAAMLIRGGTFTDWTLLGYFNTDSGTTVYVQSSNFDADYTLDNLWVPDRDTFQWFPAPVYSDTFTASDSDTIPIADGLSTGAVGGSGWQLAEVVGDFDIVSNRLTSQTTASGGGDYGTAVDQSGNSRDGTLTGFADNEAAHTADVPSPAVPGVTVSVDMTGSTSEYIAIADASNDLNYTTGDFSVAFWFNPDVNNSNRVILDALEPTDQNDGWAIRFDSSNTMGIKLGTSIYKSNDTYSTGTWYHIAIVKSGTNVSFYTNATFDVTRAAAHADSYVGDTRRIGYTAGGTHPISLGNPYDGHLADIRIYNDALTADEITWIDSGGASGTDPTTANLDLHYDFVVTAGGGIGDVATFDLGFTDIVGEFVINSPAGTGVNGMVTRYVDSDNYWIIGHDMADGDFKVNKVSAGVETTEATIASTMVANTDYTVRWYDTGTEIGIWGGTTLATVTDSTHNSSTNIGFAASTSGTDFDTVRVFDRTPIVPELSVEADTDIEVQLGIATATSNGIILSSLKEKNATGISSEASSIIGSATASQQTSELGYEASSALAASVVREYVLGGPVTSSASGLSAGGVLISPILGISTESSVAFQAAGSTVGGGSSSFVKGVNFNGSAVTIDGNTWLSQVNAEVSGLTLPTSYSSGTTSLSFTPAATADEQSMLNNVIWVSNNALQMSWTIPNDTYDVEFWIVENWQTNARQMDLRLEYNGGTLVEVNDVGQLTFQNWAKYTATGVEVVDNVLDISIENDLGFPAQDAHIMGIAIYTSDGSPPVDPPSTPVITANALTINEGGTVVLSASNIAATDQDTDDTTLTFNVTNVTNGQFEISSSPVTSFTQAQVTASSVSFVHDGSEGSPTYSVSATDGTNASASLTPTIVYTGVVDNSPIVTNGLSFVVADTATNGTSVGTVTYTDADIPADTVTFAITAGNTNNVFAINSSGVISVANQANLNDSSSYVLTVEVDDGTTTPGSNTVGIVVQEFAPQTVLLTPANINTELALPHTGDLLVVTPGTYVGLDVNPGTSYATTGFSSYLEGATIIQYPGTDATFTGSWGIYGSNTDYIGLRIIDSDSLHYDSRGGSWAFKESKSGWAMNFNNVANTGNRVINCEIAECSGGLLCTNPEDFHSYGNLLINNGWAAPDRCHGHGTYSQNQDSISSKIHDQNIYVRNFARGLQFYGVNAFIQGMYIKDCIFFNDNFFFSGAGSSQRNTMQGSWQWNKSKQFPISGAYGRPDWLSTANTEVEDLTVKNNWLYGGCTFLGLKGAVVVQNNTFVMAPNINHLPLAVFGNLVDDALVPKSVNNFTFNNNTFIGTTNGQVAGYIEYPNGSSGPRYTLSQWQALGYGSGSQHFPTWPTVNEVKVYQNVVESGRLTICIANFELSDNQTVDVSSYLGDGVQVDMVSADDPFVAPVQTTVTGGEITIPLLSGGESVWGSKEQNNKTGIESIFGPDYLDQNDIEPTPMKAAQVIIVRKTNRSSADITLPIVLPTP